MRQEATWSRIRRVPHSKGQSRSVSQQPGSKWQSELAKTELRANFNRKKKKMQSGNIHAAKAEERGWKRLGGKESGAWMENKQMGIASGGNSSVTLTLPSSSQKGVGVSGMSICEWLPLGDWLREVMTAGSGAMGQTLS